MMPRHARLVNAMPMEAREFIAWYFRVSRSRLRRARGVLTVTLAEMGVGQADVVLALVRSGDELLVRCAEGLMGRRIVRAPACLRPLAKMEYADPTPEEQRRIRDIVSNPRVPTTPAWYRWNCLRDGMTVQQALVRGIRRRDLRLGVRRGWLRIEERA